MTDRVRQFLRIRSSHGLTEAITRTFRYIHQQLILRRIFLPLIGEHPQLYRAYTRLHPRYTDADPFKLIFVDIQRITHTSEKQREQLYGKVVRGDWDEPNQRLSELAKYRALEAYIEKGDSKKYIDVFKEIRTGADWRYSTRTGASDRLEDIDHLIHSLRTDGYLPQEERSTKQFKGEYIGDRPGLVNEVTVDIGRDGTLYYCGRGGSHRLFLSKILEAEFDAIPVQVATRHARWQHIRDVIRRSNSITDVPPKYRKYLSHPDLQDVHPS